MPEADKMTGPRSQTGGILVVPAVEVQHSLVVHGVDAHVFPAGLLINDRPAVQPVKPVQVATERRGPQ